MQLVASVAGSCWQWLPVLILGGCSIVACLLCLSRLRRAQAQRREEVSRLEARLEAAARSEGVRVLAAGIAHDFNNLLSVVLGSCDLARLAASDRPALVAELDRMQRATLQSRELVVRLQEHCRGVSPQRCLVSLAAVVRETVDFVRAASPRGVLLEASVDDAAPSLHADRVQLQQLVLNLCMNAVQAIEGGSGLVRVTLERRPSSEWVDRQVGSGGIGGVLNLKVEDNGKGMSREAATRIFDPFYTTRETMGGTGLGLFIVRRIVDAHGGRIEVSSEPGRGSVFAVLLPVPFGGGMPVGDSAPGSSGAPPPCET